MGYYIFTYGVKTPEIKAVFGSKDEALLQKVKANDVLQKIICAKSVKSVKSV